MALPYRAPSQAVYLRVTRPSTEGPLSACLSAEAICSSVNLFLLMALLPPRVPSARKIAFSTDHFAGSGPENDFLVRVRQPASFANRPEVR